MYYQTIQQFTKMLNNLKVLLDKAVLHSEDKKFDMSNLLTSRLAPDQFNFIKQVQVMADNAKGAASRLAGKEAPKFEDNEQTLEELVARINKTVNYLQEFKEEDFAESATRHIVLPFMPGKYLTGADYLVEFAIPNFYFHCTTAYAILRSNGVNVGKFDYIGNANLKNIE